MGLKRAVSKIKGDLSTTKDQIRKGATMDSHNQLDRKLDAIICLNSLKTLGHGKKATCFLWHWLDHASLKAIKAHLSCLG
jgi:hypothetical protein